MRPIWRFLIGQAVLLVAVLSLPWVVLAVYPGILRATAPVLCPADQPDARIVEYSYTTHDGTHTNATLVCLGPGGDLTEVGSWAPLGVYLLGVVVLSEAVVLPIQLRGIVRRRRRRGMPPGARGPTRIPPTITLGRVRGPAPW